MTNKGILKFFLLLIGLGGLVIFQIFDYIFSGYESYGYYAVIIPVLYITSILFLALKPSLITMMTGLFVCIFAVSPFSEILIFRLFKVDHLPLLFEAHDQVVIKDILEHIKAHASVMVSMIVFYLVAFFGRSIIVRDE